MRTVRALVLLLSVAGLAGMSLRTEAQTATTLVDFTSSWRYDQSGRDLSTTSWKTAGYQEDSFWQGPGMGLLGFETTPAVYSAPFNTQLTISTTVTSYYFRTTFTFSGTTSGLSLFATNFIDDGAVIYLNNSEVGRFRVPASQNAATLASAGPATEGQFDVVAITNLSVLRQGNNQLAVEVHQIDATSSDIVWGMKLVGFQTTPLMITTQPQSQTVSVGDQVNFTVGVSGGPIVYRWYKVGTATPVGTAATYTIGSAQLGNAGDYYVVVTNTLSMVTSAVATLTVVGDTRGPEILEAIGMTNYPAFLGVPLVNLKFSENLSPATARITNNYALYAGTNTSSPVPITNLTYGITDAPRVFLKVLGTATNWMLRSNYFVVVNNVADTRGNNIDPNTRVGVSWNLSTNVARMSDPWDYYTINAFDPGGTAIYSSPWYGTNYVVDYNSGLWGNGPGILWFDPNSTGVSCAGSVGNTLLSFQSVPTLFRRTFKLPATAATNGTLTLRYIVDDGLILYLNGRLIFTNNMGPGPYSATSVAVNNINPAACSNPLDVPVTNLLPGTNWLAAGVFQSAADHPPSTESDTIFGLQVDLTVSTSPSPVPRDPPTNQLVLTLASDGTNGRISWPQGFSGYTLQGKSALGSGPSWIQVSNQANPFIGPITGETRLFRLWNGK